MFGEKRCGRDENKGKGEFQKWKVSFRFFFFFFSLCTRAIFLFRYFATNNAVSKDRTKISSLARAMLMEDIVVYFFRRTEIQFPLDFVPQNFFQRSVDVGNSRHLHTRADVHPSLSSLYVLLAQGSTWTFIQPAKNF